jgi:hypothetical protein
LVVDIKALPFHLSIFLFGIFGILIMFYNDAIERTSVTIECIAARQSSIKSDSHAEDVVFSFLLCSFASSAIERTNLCDRVLYQKPIAFQHFR